MQTIVNTCFTPFSSSGLWSVSSFACGPAPVRAVARSVDGMKAGLRGLYSHLATFGARVPVLQRRAVRWLLGAWLPAVCKIYGLVLSCFRLHPPVGGGIIARNMTAEEIIHELKPSLFLLRDAKGYGTGFLVSREGHVLTCNHVVSCDQVEVVSNESRRWTLPVLARDPSCDLALLQVAGLDAEPVVFADPASISEGQTVLALGHPLGLDFTVSRGVVSNRNRMMRGMTCVQTDVSLNPGNSGGPIANEKGEVIGVAVGLYDEAHGIGFAVALRHVFAFAARLRVRLKRVNAFPFDLTPS
jgi:S1-C subfamily serine protease